MTYRVASIGSDPPLISTHRGYQSSNRWRSVNRMWQRTWEAKRWMPFTWAQIGMPGAGPGGIAFYGPYVVVDGPEGNLSMDATPHVECTLRMIVQFRGQR